VTFIDAAWKRCLQTLTGEAHLAAPGFALTHAGAPSCCAPRA
jgi:hypothetical protein